MRIAVIVFLSVTAACSMQAQIPVPERGCYHSAFIGMGTQAQFAELAKKKLAVEMFYTKWNSSKVADFPSLKCAGIAATGAVPHITWEAMITGSPYPLSPILDGSYDAYIIAYAKQAKAWTKPFFIRFGHEMNGNWYEWSGVNNGGKTTNGFGDAAVADGPERFVAAYRRVHRLFDSVGVTNATWIWCPNAGSWPNETWNTVDAYYPGDDVVDWVGLDGYNWGTTQTGNSWKTFFETYNSLYNECEKYSKPMMVAEFSSAEDGGSKADWITNAYLMMRVRYPKIKAVTWFHIDKETHWQINSSAASLAAYQAAIGDPYFLDAVPAPTAVTHEAGHAPSSFAVGNAYPNPFNGSVVVEYSLPAASVVTITVANVLGQIVHAGTVEADGGMNRFHWDGRASGGAGAASGMYFVAIAWQHTMLVQKIVYQK